MSSFEAFYKKFYKHPVNRSELQKSLKFERNYYKKIIKILSKNYNKRFSINESYSFWEKILGQYIYFHITQTTNIFRSAQEKKKFNKIKINHIEYIIPENLLDYRTFYQKSFNGQKWLYYIYLNYANKFSLKKNKKFLKKSKRIKQNEKIKFNFLNYLIRFINIIFRFLSNKEILASGIYWTEKNKILINYLLKGKFLNYNFFLEHKDVDVSFNLRNDLFQIKSKNKFDHFFFESLKYSAPKSLVENLQNNIEETVKFSNKHNKIKYFLNENLSEANLFLNAILSKKKVKTIYIQHNFISHVYLSNQLDFILDKFDKYFSLGWQDSENPKIEKFGSLFKWQANKNLYPLDRKDYILFVPTIPLEIIHYTSGYLGECGKLFSKQYIETEKVFFENLNNENKNQIIYKQFPKNILTFEDNTNWNIIKKNLKKNNIKYFDSKKLNVEEYFLNSKLIVVSYMATTYLQALISNKPTVIFFNKNSYFLKKKYANYFEELFDAKILHNNASDAAEFINYLDGDFLKWWDDKKTILLRKKFLSKNYQSKEFAHQKLLKLK